MKKEYIITDRDNIRMKLFYATIFAMIIHVVGCAVILNMQCGNVVFTRGDTYYNLILRFLEFAGIALYFLLYADKPKIGICCFIPSFIVYFRYFIVCIVNMRDYMDKIEKKYGEINVKVKFSTKFLLSGYLPIVINLLIALTIIVFVLYINGLLDMPMPVYAMLALVFASSIICALILLSAMNPNVPMTLEDLFTRSLLVCILTVAFINLVPKKQIIDTIMASEEENKTYSSETATEAKEDKEDIKETDLKETDLKKEDAKEEEKEDKADSEEKTEDTESDEDEEKSEDKEETKED
ncbi:MAG: hypothetical protein K6G26_01295 [Lachnospiraceae bacterium]|nr:hypothetical protein [Lachnospiraceae bacterium]